MSETLDEGGVTVRSMLIEAASDPTAEHEAAGERLLIAASRAGNLLNIVTAGLRRSPRTTLSGK
jgi:hypothetical protein